MSDSIASKQKILKNFLDICTISGWTNEALEEAVFESKIDDATILFGNGIYGLIDFYIDQGNIQLKKNIENIDIQDYRIRDKIFELVKSRLEIENENKNALKALITVSKGKRIPYLIKNIYKISDLLWNIAGDSSNDINFYTKRLILSKIFVRTFIFFIDDESKNNINSWNFLRDQIDKVMMVAKFKSNLSSFKKKINKRGEILSIVKNKVNQLPFIRLIKPNNRDV